MGRKRSLLYRLDQALNSVSSQREEARVYSLLYQTGKKVLDLEINSLEIDKFYGEILSFQSLNPEKDINVIDPKEVKKGKELADRLRTKIVWPENDLRVRGYGRRYARARTKEFHLLNEFYRGESDCTSIQS